jgi:hypothetical protein
LSPAGRYDEEAATTAELIPPHSDECADNRELSQRLHPAELQRGPADVGVGSLGLLMSSWFAYSMFFAAKMRKIRKKVKFSGLLSSVFKSSVCKSSVFKSSSLLSEAQPRYFCGFCASLRLTECIPSQGLLSMNDEF